MMSNMNTAEARKLLDKSHRYFAKILQIFDCNGLHDRYCDCIQRHMNDIADSIGIKRYDPFEDFDFETDNPYEGFDYDEPLPPKDGDPIPVLDLYGNEIEII